MQKFRALARKSIPLYVEVAAILRNRIIGGEFAAGVQLPTLAQLIEEFEVSRVTVRQAMDLLETEGLIERGSGRGTFVREFPKVAREVLSLSARLDTLSEMVRGGDATILSTDKSECQIDMRLTGLDEADVNRNFTFLRRMHSKGGQPFSLVDLIIRSEIFALAPERFENEIAVSVFKDLDVEISAADQIINIATATLEQASILAIDVNSPIADVYRTFRDYDGRVFYAARIIYPSSFISFHIRFDP